VICWSTKYVLPLGGF